MLADAEARLPRLYEQRERLADRREENRGLARPSARGTPCPGDPSGLFGPGRRRSWRARPFPASETAGSVSVAWVPLSRPMTSSAPSCSAVMITSRCWPTPYLLAILTSEP